MDSNWQLFTFIFILSSEVLWLEVTNTNMMTVQVVLTLLQELQSVICKSGRRLR